MNMEQVDGFSYYSFPHMQSWPELTQAAFGRSGGVSEGPYESLNVSLAVQDDAERVRVNRSRMAAAVGWDAGRIVSARQVHGRQVAQVVAEMAGGADLPDVDALVTDEPGVLLMMKFADCVPVVLWDPVRRAVALAHAGWRGSVTGTPAATVAFMEERFGCDPSDILAGIGPSIGPCCYQVGSEVVTLAEKVFAGAGVLLRESESDVRFDLWTANSETLLRAGVREENIKVAGICTRCHSDVFFSHRAAGGGLAGRFGVVAGIRDE
jgi:polyphenol oxidase